MRLETGFEERMMNHQHMGSVEIFLIDGRDMNNLCIGDGERERQSNEWNILERMRLREQR